jgi:putative endopeptidase
MRAVLLSFVCAVFLAAGAAPQDKTTPAEESPKAIPGFDLNALDKSADPCENFYQYACGTWIKDHPVPADRGRYGRFDELEEHNRAVLRDILEKAAAPDPKRSAVMQKIGDYYASCMDEKKIDALGAKPIVPEMDRIAALNSRADLGDELAHLHIIGVNALFNFYPNTDFKDARMMVANVDQGGLVMPDRDYYIKDDAKFQEIRKEYLGHIQKMFELLGDAPVKAAEEAKTVMTVETALAKVSMDRTQRRDPRNRDHKMKVVELEAAAPDFSFARYLKDMQLYRVQELNVVNPVFFKQVNAQIGAVPFDEWKTYLRWHVLDTNAPMLSAPFVNEDFHFKGQVLQGQKEIKARWKRCVAFTDNDLGEALGQPYVDETFGVEGKQRTLAMVQALEKALNADIKDLSWMTDATRKLAEQKLAAIHNKIGYPDKWRDYSKLEIIRGDAMGNSIRANEFESRREINKVDKPVDPNEWGMTPPTVNAYYSPGRNEIVFPAGILQPPFYDNKLDDAVNYGGIGAVIGHELTHGFDDQGRKYDASGNLRDWWTPEDAAEFEKRATCIADEYSVFNAIDDVKLNGRLTLGENTADNGGIRLAYMALMNTIAGKNMPKIDGYTPEQRFFLGQAQVWCQNATPEDTRRRVVVDPHSPGRYRVIGPDQNMPEFQKAWGCKPGQKMVSANACRVW